MSLNPKVKNPLILSIVSTVFLVPVLILTMYLFSAVNWILLIVTVVIYFIIIFLVFLYYGNMGKK